MELKDDNEKYKYILLLICKKLGKVIPQVFDGVTDYIDILIPDNLLNESGFVNKIVTGVPEENYAKVEIIGWLYQYYNQTEKDRVISSKKQYKKNEIAYATQVFTPNWIVKYMVENSLGRYWVERNYDEINTIAKNWKYLIKDNIEKINENIKPTEITFIDPCSGSGHILVYAFEIFMQIYKSSGYSIKEIPELILRNNLYGLDIDDRAGQLSVLSVLLKAREYDNNIFNKIKGNDLNIMSLQESNKIDLSFYDEDFIFKSNINYLIDTFKNAKGIGSLLKVEKKNYKYAIDNLENNLMKILLLDQIKPLIKQANILSNKYTIVVTNPPYIPSSLMDKDTKIFINKEWIIGKNDVYSSFILRCLDMLNKCGYFGYLSPYIWMYTFSFTDFRKYIVNNINIVSLVQLEYNAFDGACVPVATGIMSKIVNNKYKKGTYIDLSNFKGSDIQAPRTLFAIENNCDYKYNYSLDLSKNTKDNIISFRASDKIIEIFNNYDTILKFGNPKQGIATSDNKRFLRKWYEVDIHNIQLNSTGVDECINSNKKWFPYNKGGEYRKWYGNIEYVVNWYNDGYEIKNFKDEDGKLLSRPQNLQYLFRNGITWTLLSSSYFGCRYLPYGYISDINGMSLFMNDSSLIKYTLGLFCSKLTSTFLKIISPTFAFQSGDISKIPFKVDYKKVDFINSIVDDCINVSKIDWDLDETSWNFKKHPFLFENYKNSNIKKTLENFNDLLLDYNFRGLKKNEEELNRIFIDIYGLQDELTPEVDDNDITIRKADKLRDIKSLISYAVGCMFGRYSLDEEGLIYAGGEFDESKYKTFNVDKDNIIPITDDSYFADDIVSRFRNFIEVVYGKETLNENLDFIAETLGKKGTETSEDTIRRYFLNDFYKDHVKMYQKKPIYWLFDSGKKNGFKALIYMHRYNENTVPKVRLDYLHRIQNTYDKLLSDVNYKLTTELSVSDKKIAQNRQADLNAKLQEINEYDEKIAHIANQRIIIDLDDGVTVNYAKFEAVLAKIK